MAEKMEGRRGYREGRIEEGVKYRLNGTNYIQHSDNGEDSNDSDDNYHDLLIWFSFFLLKFSMILIAGSHLVLMIIIMILITMRRQRFKMETTSPKEDFPTEGMAGLALHLRCFDRSGEHVHDWLAFFLAAGVFHCCFTVA